MNNNKLFTLLRTFSKIERNQFRKYLISPFFNENQFLVKLFDSIVLSIAKGKLGEPTKQQIWKKLYPKKEYNDVKFRRLNSDLLKLGMDFIGIQKFNEAPFFKYNFQLAGLGNSELEKHFDSTLRQTELQFEKTKLQNSDYHFANFRLNIEKDRFHKGRKKSGEPLRYLSESDKYLDAFYFISKLRNYCTTLIYKMVRATSYEMNFGTNLLSRIKKSQVAGEPAILIYLEIIALLESENSKEHLTNLKKLIQKNTHCFSSEELQSFYLFAQNFCAIQINRGKLEYYTEAFLLYKILIENALILENGIIKQGTYKNIITTGLKVNETDWIENFIKEYTPKLPLTFQDNALNYNLARVYFHEKKYEKVIEQLREVHYKNLIYALGGKLLLIETYYELKEHQALDSLIDSFRIYLRRNQLISKEVQVQYMNALKFVKKLSTLAPYDEKGLEKVKEQINNCKALAAKKWLLEKIEAF